MTDTTLTSKRLRAGTWLAVTFLALGGGLLVSAAADRQPAKNAQQNAHDAFDEADLEFRSLYGQGRAATLGRLGPIIVVEMDSLVQIRGGKRVESPVIPPLYHHLKSVSHIPLALYVALAPFGDAPLDDGRRAGLRALRARIAAVSDLLDRSGFDAAQVARSRSLLNRCSAFIDDVLKTGTYAAAELKALTRFAGPIVLANVQDAARAQIDAYHARVTAWRREVPADEWARLRVLVLGPQMPRKHNVAVQYFAKLMGVSGESRRLVYAEELAGEVQGLNLLATHQLDSELSEAFFADPERMEIDLLGNAAAEYLDGLDLGR